MRSSHPRSAAVSALVATALATGLLAGTADAAEGAASADPIRIHDIQGTTAYRRSTASRSPMSPAS